MFEVVRKDPKTVGIKAFMAISRWPEYGAGFDRTYVVGNGGYRCQIPEIVRSNFGAISVKSIPGDVPDGCEGTCL